MKYIVTCYYKDSVGGEEVYTTDDFQYAVLCCCKNCVVTDEEGEVVHEGVWDGGEEDWDEPDVDEVGVGEVDEQQENEDFAHDNDYGDIGEE